MLFVPLVGEFRSNQIGVFTGSAIILGIAYFTIRWTGAKRRLELLTVGFLWLLLTVALFLLHALRQTEEEGVEATAKTHGRPILKTG